MEPGGDADFAVAAVSGSGGFWSSIGGAPAVATDFVHGNHQRSIKYRASQPDTMTSGGGVMADAGRRISTYFYFNAIPSTTLGSIIRIQQSGGTNVVTLRITNAGVLQLWNAETAQIGTDGPTLSLGQWYRICLAYTITDTTHNRFELFVDGVSAISITNATLTNVTTNKFVIGNCNGKATMDMRSSDHYVDDSAALTDTGDIWVTAKRPLANGTTNGFTTQIGAGGSGYGSGHAPQVNERALSTTNGWSMVGAGAAVTEEYSIEGPSVGDFDISTAIIIDLAA